MKQSNVIFASFLLVIAVLPGCVSQPTSTADIPQAELSRYHKAIDGLKQIEKLQPYFQDAKAYALYPGVGRAGLGFGAAYGRGFVFQDSQIIGVTRITQVNVGFNMGGQFYRQIVFFKTPEALAHFKRGNLELGGQANAALITLGGGVTPAPISDIAIFTQLRGGLLIEVSIGGHYYSFSPLVGANDKDLPTITEQ
jgi:lipid-binding SYLF domain-containing protein